MNNENLYFQMLRIRMIEERIAKEYPKGKMRCPVHLSVGQEAAAVGICAGLTKDDKMVSTHRSHAHYLAKGGSLKGLIGELYGKSTGCSRGNGGSMHLIDLDCGFFGSTSIVGGTIPVGVGLAFADKIKGSNAKTVICIGDAAIEEGVFHESANFASLHRLNVIFACENNQYSCYTHIKDRQAVRHSKNLENVTTGYGLGYAETNEDPESIMDAMKWASRYLPCFVEIPTWRKLQHCGPDTDDHLGYRKETPPEDWWDINKQNNSDIMRIDQEITEAFADAEAAPWPEGEQGKYVYASPT